MDEHGVADGTHHCSCGEETEGGRGQSAGEEGECCGGYGSRHERADAGELKCGCGDGSPIAADIGAEQAGRHSHGEGHGGGCCGGGHGEHGGHGHHEPRGDRSMPTPAERVAMLEQYLKDLVAETQAVEERLAQLKAAA